VRDSLRPNLVVRNVLVLATVLLATAAGVTRAGQIAFGPQRIVSTTEGLGLDIIAGDLDGDGDQDLVVSGGTNTGSGVYWYRNLDGAGTYSSAQAIGAGQLENRVSIELVDMDRDGDLDLLSGWAYLGAWYPNDGQGNFGARTLVRDETFNGSGYDDFAAADLDGDGDPDVVGLSGSSFGPDKLVWFRNNGGGSFNPATENLIDNLPNDNGGLGNVIPADMDGDGDIDLVATQGASFGGDVRVVWYANTGTGTFGTKLTISTAVQMLSDIAVADIDGDGDADVVSVDYGFNACRWHENTIGDGTAWTDRMIAASNSVSFFVKAADMDLDGDPDVLLSDRVNGQARWVENTAGDGSTWTNRLIQGGLSSPSGSAAADLDGDGDLDVATASVSDNKFAWTENRTIHRNADFPFQALVATSVEGARSMQLADLDGDGDLDVLSGSLAVRWHENVDGSGTSWSTATVQGAGLAPGGTAVSDLDGDGDLDVLSIDNVNGNLAWVENAAGDGSVWSVHAIPHVGAEGSSVQAADIDGDGDQDVVSTMTSGRVSWHENLGAGSWAEHAIASHTFNFDTIPVDLDRDGDIDVVNTSATGAIWYANLGDGSAWSAAQPIGLLDGNIRRLGGGDLDGDGDFDVVLASPDFDTVEWYENTSGDGSTWVEGTISTSADGVWGIAVADLDADGDMDIVSSSLNSDEIVVHENTASDGSLWTRRLVSVLADNPYGVAVGDIDGDGRVDLASNSRDDQEVAWYPNLGGQFGFDGADISTGSAYDGELVPLLGFEVRVNGRPGDSVGRLASLPLRFETPTGLLDAAMTSAEANALFDEVRIYRDTGSDEFEANADILVATVGTLSLTAGVQAVTFSANDPNMRIAAPAAYWVVALMTGTASQQVANGFDATVLASGMAVVDASAGIPLVAGELFDVESGTLTARARFVVDTTSDGVDASPGDLICATGGGACTLRAAIQEANAHAGADRIVLPAGTFTLSITGTGENAAATGDLDVTDVSGALTLVGAGAEQTILSAGSVDRAFHLLASASLTLEGVTITGGNVGLAGAGGGAVQADGTNTLILRRCAIRGNNTANVGGPGAISTSGTSTVTIENSVIHGNTGGATGSAIFNGSTMTITSCTISGNTSGTTAGVAVESTGTLNVNNSTITANMGGLRQQGASATTVAGSIVAGNPQPLVLGDDIVAGNFVSGGYNFIGESAIAAFTNGVNGDQVGSSGSPLDPQLEPLGNYGGTTLTHPPLSGSPVVDKGRCLLVTTDQRGVSRPIDIGGITNAADGCDCGACELETGSTLARLELPIRWCGLRGSPSIENPSLMGATNVNDLLRRRHEAASDNIWLPQTGIAFRSAANFIVEDYPLLQDPDCVEGPPDTFTCEKGVRGDVYIDPDTANFDEYEALIAACRAAWQAQDPTIEGVTAVQINHFIDAAGTPLSILGIGGRAQENDAREQIEAGRVAVVDHFYRQSVPGNPSPPNPSDTIDRLLAHELGHSVSLRHGDGLDNDNNGSIDDNDEATVGLPRFDGDNIMQYRSGAELTAGQATQARAHMLATVPDVRVQPLGDGAPNALPVEQRNLTILDFGFDGVLNLANLRILDFRNLGLLDFEQNGVNDFANLRLLDFKNLSILDFKNLSILDFGMSYDNETPAGSTSLHATTAAIPWPPSVRLKTRYFYYLDVDRDDATGAYPAFKVNPSDAPNHFPGSDNFANNPNIALEAGVDLIAQVDLESSCSGDNCSSTSTVRIFDYDDGTGQYVQVSSSSDPDISTVSAGLYVDNGGAPVDLDSAPTGITIQPKIPNSLLFAAGWGFTTPGGGQPPVPNPVRMEVISTVTCSGNVLNDGSAADTRQCQCNNCASCPDYPGCVGTSGVPQTLVGTSILTDDTGGELNFRPPVLPQCTVIPELAAQGQAVTVHVTQLPTNLSGTVEVTRGATVIGTTPTGSISAVGSVNVSATLPSTALGQVTLSAGITGYAPRAQCLVTVTPTVACVDTDADGTCDTGDSDDDNDGVADGSDAAPLNRLACRDVDADQCDDCSGGTTAPSLDGPDYDHDGLCDRGDPDDDNDGVLDGVDGQPQNGNACGDSDHDNCDDCVIASSPSPNNDGPDVEGDGLCDFGDPDDDNDGQSDWADCAPLDGTLRASPSEVSGVRFGSGGVKHRLIWTAPQAQGGSATVSDVVRGTLAGLPVGSGAETCLAPGTAAAQVDDATNPGSGTANWYLVRAKNACGTGSYGNRSSGTPRISSACP